MITTHRIDPGEVFSSIASRLTQHSPMPRRVDDFRKRSKKFWTSVVDEALSGLANLKPQLVYSKNARLPAGVFKPYSKESLPLSAGIERRFDEPRTGQLRARNQLSSAEFLRRVQNFVQNRRCYDGVLRSGECPQVVSEVEWLLGYDEFLVDFVKLLYAKVCVKLFVHRCPDERRAVLPLLQEFMACFTDHVEGEVYLIILAMDFSAPGHTIGHCFTVPRSGRLSKDEIVFTQVEGSPHAWPV
jgi:hypothetical protein